MNKYHAKKTRVDGVLFDSKKEAERWSDLMWLQKIGEIDQVRRQVRFELQEAFDKDDKHYKPIVYVADFVYRDLVSGKIVVEDVKGMKTEVYRLKKKWFEHKYPDLTITEV